MRRSLLILVAVFVGGCVDVGSAPPPSPPSTAVSATLSITAPADGATVTVRPDADRTLTVAFVSSGVTLREPGTCLASEQPCGHVLARVDGSACSPDGQDFNSAGASSPLVVALGLCPSAAGEHTIELQLVGDDRAPLLDASGASFSAAVTVTAEVPSLYVRLGEEEGIRHLLTGFLSSHVLPDPRVNAYFHNASVDLDSLLDCLVDQVGEASGGPQTYDCRSMAEAHAGLGISSADFADFGAILEETALYHGVAAADVADLLVLIDGTEGDVVQDADGSQSFYQRAGRRPGLEAVVDAFADGLLVDLQVSPFFVPTGEMAPSYQARTGVCVMRLLCSIDGPCVYGEGTEAALEGEPCLNMRDSHVERTNPAGDPIGLSHFAAVAELLVAELDAAGVAPIDQELVFGALVPTCCDIVGDGGECQPLFDSLGLDLSCGG